MSCVTIEDFIKPVTKLTERKYTWISKGEFLSKYYNYRYPYTCSEMFCTYSKMLFKKYHLMTPTVLALVHSKPVYINFTECSMATKIYFYRSRDYIWWSMYCHGLCGITIGRSLTSCLEYPGNGWWTNGSSVYDGFGISIC